MPHYIDIHTVHGGATVDGAAQADAADLKAQGAHDVRYLRYWVSEAASKTFCLVDAPSAEAREFKSRPLELTTAPSRGRVRIRSS